jgi:hypothetical protein
MRHMRVLSSGSRRKPSGTTVKEFCWANYEDPYWFLTTGVDNHTPRSLE